MEIKTVTVERHFDREMLEAHVLEPGDCVWLVSSQGEKWGVVVNSPLNNDLQVEASIDGGSCQLYARRDLRWMGPIE